MSWQVGDEGRIVGTFIDTATKAPIEWTGTEATVTLKPPGEGEVEAEIASVTEDGGKVTAPYLFAKRGVWRGHIVLTGEYRRKVPFRLEVFDE